MVWVPAKMMLLAEAFSVPLLGTYVQLRVVRRLAVRVSVPDGLLMVTTVRVSVTRLDEPLQVWAPLPLISRVALPPVKAAAMLMLPCAARVPVAAAWLSSPLVRVSVPGTLRIVPAAMVIVPPASSTAPSL